MRVKRVFVEASRCTAHTLCKSEVPEGQIEIAFSESENFEIATIKENLVPKTQKALIKLIQADDVCPMDAFRVELANGEIFLASDPLIQSKLSSGQIEWA